MENDWCDSVYQLGDKVYGLCFMFFVFMSIQ